MNGLVRPMDNYGDYYNNNFHSDNHHNDNPTLTTTIITIPTLTAILPHNRTHKLNKHIQTPLTTLNLPQPPTSPNNPQQHSKPLATPHTLNKKHNYHNNNRTPYNNHKVPKYK